jgi:hypothetical protein
MLLSPDEENEDLNRMSQHWGKTHIGLCRFILGNCSDEV